jgi:SNF2 family DNA or RNA helicase
MGEARSKSGCLRIYIYHGHKRCRDPVELARNYDVVVTTYQTLGADHGGEHDPLGSIRWYRVVMYDGPPVLKKTATKQSQAICKVQSERRWLCTDTPINNATTDLYGQFCALQLAPANNKAFFDLHWKKMYEARQHIHPDTANDRPTLAFTLKSTVIRWARRL